MIGLAAARSRINDSPLARRFLGGAAWSVFGAIGSSGITLVMWMIVARLLGKEAYGQFVVLQSTLSMVGTFAGLGMGAAATRYAAELRSTDPVRLGRILVLCERSIVGFGVIASVALVASADWLASRILNSPALGGLLSIAAVVVPFAAIDGYQKSVLVGLESMRAFATGAIIALVIGSPIVLIATYAFGLLGAAIGIAALAFIQAAVSRHQMITALKRIGIPRNASGCLKELPVLWHFALPALLSGVLVGPVHWVAQAMLANTPNGYAELAVLGIAMQWFNLILFVPGSAGRVVLPMLTDYVARGDLVNSRKIMRNAILANAAVVVPLAAAAGMLSPYVMNLYGQTYADDYSSLIIAALTASILAIQTPVGNLLAAKSRMWLGASMNLGWAFVYLVCTFMLARNGASGVLTALLLAYIAHAVWTFWFALHQTASPAQFSEAGRA